MPDQIDYQKVNGILQEKRNASLEWLRTAICNPEPQHSVVDTGEKLYPLRMVKSVFLHYGKSNDFIRKIFKK